MTPRTYARLWHGPVTFRFAIGAIMLTLLVGSVAVVSMLSYYFGQKNVEDLGRQILQQTLGRAQLRLFHLVDQAADQNRVCQQLMADGAFSPADFAAIRNYLPVAVEVNQDLSCLGFGVEKTGCYVMAHRPPDGSITAREYLPLPDGNPGMRDYQFRDSRLVPAGERPSDGYDPRTRPYYRLAKEKRKPVWTDAYDFWPLDGRGEVPGVTLATPSYDAAGNLLGVWHADFDVRAMNEFLGRVQRETSIAVFVIETRHDGARRVLAQPQRHDSPAAAHSTVNDRFVELLPGFIAADRGGSKTPPLHEFALAGEFYMASHSFLSGDASPHWIIGMVLPKAIVMAHVEANRRWALAILLACSALACVTIFIVARTVAVPLLRVTDDAAAIGHLRLEPKPETRSRIREINRLLRSVEGMKTNLRSFQKYVPSDLVRELVQSGTEARLGGHRDVLTIAFSDIANFTPIAESLPPEALLAQLGEYLGALSQSILRHRGTVDKYLGDGIIAFWGAPRPNPAHALDACTAALEQQCLLRDMNALWRAAGKPQFHTRIGIHTGEVIVGNVGSADRMDYTVIGDAVNLASRLEGLNKLYGTRILITADTWAPARERIAARPVDLVQVKGKTQGTLVYELLGLAADLDDALRHRITDTTTAFDLYQRGDFAGAAAVYGRLLQAQPEDSVARILRRRCEERSIG